MPSIDQTEGLTTEHLKTYQITKYLINIIETYFCKTKVSVFKKGKEVTSGVPQGYELGPNLWNVLFDGILRLYLGEVVSTFCFTDDLAMVVTTKLEHELSKSTNETLRGAGS